MLMKELVLDAAEETYVTVPTEFINNTECDALYVPQNPLSACPPVFVEAQNQYSTLIFESALSGTINVATGKNIPVRYWFELA
ncbi:hypothetical protein BCV71DRAFT_292529 [Rhizopus microsporus]|uniref:Uncharacterized protein n=1 Tax=Rhizopus microsporus TaxID=58291 RepID=A0A1X0RVM9_RHIZD|nr:hypothetical protein BCV71DRAFT_292529 [Rhizopus microsporus]